MVDQVFKIKENVLPEKLRQYGYVEEKIGNRHKCFLPQKGSDIYISVSIDMNTRIVTVLYENALEILLPLFNDKLLEYNKNVVKDTFDWGR